MFERSIRSSEGSNARQWDQGRLESICRRGYAPRAGYRLGHRHHRFSGQALTRAVPCREPEAGQEGLSFAVSRADEPVAGAASADVVELRIPAKAEWVAVARLAVAAVASRSNFSLEDIEDVRLAIA